ncbi:MAG: fibrillarin-like rRNA/tRNA 2'-O-methyltransferase [Methanosarcinaceae archaeon]|nr:fibrillarin-like rRNA/tRNA 2'-O-methyltransferase [Methanosarcinaceae archaeon]
MDFNKNSGGFRQVLPGIYSSNRASKYSLFTKSANPNVSVYGENIFCSENFEYRLWDPKRSKLGALLQKRAKISFFANTKVLYLGAASGTTVSHISDILADENNVCEKTSTDVAKNPDIVTNPGVVTNSDVLTNSGVAKNSGVVYAVEFSERPARDLVNLASVRKNIIPILSDASAPSKYSFFVEPVDVIFQDISQPNQAEIAIKNATYFLKDGGKLILSIKSRSISSVENPKKIYRQEIKKLEAGNEHINFVINNTYDLAPFHIDHMGVVATLNKKK